MAKTLNPTPQQLRHWAVQLRQLALPIQAAAAQQDWEALQRSDAALRDWLAGHKAYLRLPPLAAEVAQVKAMYRAAMQALNTATQSLRQEMDSFNAQQERALAYQFAMTLE